MGLVKGGFLRLFQTFLYCLAFCCAAIILGIYSYFLAALADHNLHIATWKKAVEGLSGAAVLYTICAILLTCCLAGVTFFSFLGLVFDVLFIGAMVAIAVLTRKGVNSCSGNVNTPLGNGLSNSHANGIGIKLGTACKLEKAVFAVAIAGAVIFFVTALMQILLARHHKKEKAYGPSPTNNYTSGSTNRKFYQRKPKTYTEKDAELGTATTGTVVGASAGLAPKTRSGGPDLRASHDTAYTGSTVGAPTGNTPIYARKDAVEPGHDGHAAHVGWEPHNHGTAAVPNPYGYDTTTTQPPTGTAAQNF